VSHRVSITPSSRRSVEALRGKARGSFDAAVERLAAEGCAAGDYRLTGEHIEHICAVHLYGRHRALVAFPDEESVVVLLVGEHAADDPDLDVYRSLYRLLDLPEPSAKRTKPPCCREDGEPPVDADLLDRFRDAATELSRRARRSRSH
jgi:hypothetical protein